MSAASRAANLSALLERAGVHSVTPGGVARAFVHESAVRDGLEPASNERLEFFGDALVGFLTAEWLIAEHGAESEGSLSLRKSALVSDVALARTAQRLGFGELIRFGAGTARLPAVRLRSTLAGAFEAFVAALYNVGGLEVAQQFLRTQHLSVADQAGVPAADPKTALQELTQARYGSLPAYVERFEGPPHERVYHASVRVNGEPAGEGSGGSKRAAQRAAAEKALAALRADGDGALRARSAKAGDVMPQTQAPVTTLQTQAGVAERAPSKDADS